MSSHRLQTSCEGDEVQVIVEGSLREGCVIGIEGDRVFVEFQHDGAWFYRWFDKQDIL